MVSASVLIVTAKLDPHADAVIDCLEPQGISVFRINTEDLLAEYKVSLRFAPKTGATGTISDSLCRTLNLNGGLRAGYYRKPERVNPPINLMDDGLRTFAVAEAEASVEAIYRFPNIRWVNDPIAIRNARSKFLQLHVASTFGFRVPHTLITQDPSEVMEFFMAHKKSVICKPLAATTVNMSGQSHQVFTHKLSEQELLNQLDSIAYCPVFLQEYIEKKYEIRATVIGSQVFSCRIDSQLAGETQIDWRKVNPFEVPHSPVDLPPDVAVALVNVVTHFGLEFGAADLIVTPTGEYVFLENNPNGQWYWVELITAQPMAKAMASLLLSK